jgi:hypothetical protein
MPQEPLAPRPTAETRLPYREPLIGDPHDAPVDTNAPAAGAPAGAAGPASAAAQAPQNSAAPETRDDVASVVLDRPPVYAAAMPSTPVAPRERARVDPAALRMIEDGAVKHNTFPSRPGFPSGASNLRTHLQIEAWVRGASDVNAAQDAADDIMAWVDVHVSTYDGTVVHQETLPLTRTPTARDGGGDVFVLDRELYQGLIATPGSVTPRPDARVVQYRLYVERGGDVYTDGRVHLCYLKPDAMSG